MADLGSTKIGSNYQKLLQISSSGLVADGSGSYTTLTLSGSQYYTSGSGAGSQVLMALGVTGSVVPEGGAKWDLGSPNNPFRHLFVSEQSITFINENAKKGSTDREIRLTKADVTDWLKGDFTTKIDSKTKRRLVVPLASTIRTAGVEPFLWDSSHNLVSNDLTSLHIVSDKFWLWNSDSNELEPRSIMFGYATDSSQSYDLIIGG